MGSRAKIEALHECSHILSRCVDYLYSMVSRFEANYLERRWPLIVKKPEYRSRKGLPSRALRSRRRWGRVRRCWEHRLVCLLKMIGLLLRQVPASVCPTVTAFSLRG